MSRSRREEWDWPPAREVPGTLGWLESPRATRRVNTFFWAVIGVFRWALLVACAGTLLAVLLFLAFLIGLIIPHG